MFRLTRAMPAVRRALPVRALSSAAAPTAAASDRVSAIKTRLRDLLKNGVTDNRAELKKQAQAVVQATLTDSERHILAIKAKLNPVDTHAEEGPQQKTAETTSILEMYQGLGTTKAGAGSAKGKITDGIDWDRMRKRPLSNEVLASMQQLRARMQEVEAENTAVPEVIPPVNWAEWKKRIRNQEIVDELKAVYELESAKITGESPYNDAISAVAEEHFAAQVKSLEAQVKTHENAISELQKALLKLQEDKIRFPFESAPQRFLDAHPEVEERAVQLMERMQVGQMGAHPTVEDTLADFEVKPDPKHDP